TAAEVREAASDGKDQLTDTLTNWLESSNKVRKALNSILEGRGMKIDALKTGALPALRKFTPSPEWTKLPIFDRKGWERVRFGDVVRQLKEEVDPKKGRVERYVAGEHMETENVHIRKWGTVGGGYL